MIIQKQSPSATFLVLHVAALRMQGSFLIRRSRLYPSPLPWQPSRTFAELRDGRDGQFQGLREVGADVQQ